MEDAVTTKHDFFLESLTFLISENRRDGGGESSAQRAQTVQSGL